MRSAVKVAHLHENVTDGARPDGHRNGPLTAHSTRPRRAGVSLPSNESKPRHAKRCPVTDRDRARFAKYLEQGPVPEHRPELGPCLIFTGSKKTGYGYGQFQWGGWKGPNRSAHAFAWESVNGPIPPGLTVDHLCRVTACVQVAHLELVTRAENYRRAREAATHCRNGHPYTIGPVGDGHLRCMTCRRGKMDRDNARKKARGFRLANGLPDRRYRIPQAAIDAALKDIADGMTVKAAAVKHGMNRGNLGARVRAIRADQP